MINVTCRKVEKKERGTMRTFVPRTVFNKRKQRKIPKTAIYRTHSGHRPRVGAGCGPDEIDNYVYWDKDLNKVLDVRVEDNTTWYHIEGVPKGVITQHRNALHRWLEELK